MKGIWTAISLLILVALLWTNVRAEGDSTGGKTQVAMLRTVDATFYSTVKGIIDVPDPLLTLTPKVTEDASQTEQQREQRQQVRDAQLQNLVKSISAVEDRQVGLTDKKKLEIAEAALLAQEQTGVDAVFMVALARMESDFRPITQVNAACKLGLQQYGCYADCGLTQHHVRGPAKYVNARCSALAKNIKEVFQLSAGEIALHVKWCLDHAHQPLYRPLRQCVLNRYNMGPYYKTAGGCRKQYGCNSLQFDPQRESVEEFAGSLVVCKAQERKCIVRAAYWEQVTCFEYGARKQLRSTRNCRGCGNITHIQRFFYKNAQEPAGVAASGTTRPSDSTGSSSTASPVVIGVAP